MNNKQKSYNKGSNAGSSLNLNFKTAFLDELFFQIILIAVLLAALLKKPDIEEETDFDPDISNKLKKDEELIHTEPKRGKI